MKNQETYTPETVDKIYTELYKKFKGDKNTEIDAKEFDAWYKKRRYDRVPYTPPLTSAEKMRRLRAKQAEYKDTYFIPAELRPLIADMLEKHRKNGGTVTCDQKEETSKKLAKLERYENIIEKFAENLHPTSPRGTEARKLIALLKEAENEKKV